MTYDDGFPQRRSLFCDELQQRRKNRRAAHRSAPSSFYRQKQNESVQVSLISRFSPPQLTCEWVSCPSSCPKTLVSHKRHSHCPPSASGCGVLFYSRFCNPLPWGVVLGWCAADETCRWYLRWGRREVDARATPPRIFGSESSLLNLSLKDPSRVPLSCGLLRLN